MSASSCWRVCFVCSLLWWLQSERQLVPARLFGVFQLVLVFGVLFVVVVEVE